MTHSVSAYCSFPGPHGLVRRLPSTIRQGIWSGLAARAGTTSARFPSIPLALNPPVILGTRAWRCWTSANRRNQKCPSWRQVRESSAPQHLALMVRSPWLAAVLRSSPAFLLAKGRIRSAVPNVQRQFRGLYGRADAVPVRSAIVRVGFLAD